MNSNHLGPSEMRRGLGRPQPARHPSIIRTERRPRSPRRKRFLESALHLSDDELVALTQRERRSAQSRVLDALHIPYRARPDHSLIVMRVDVQALSGAKSHFRPEPQLVLP